MIHCLRVSVPCIDGSPSRARSCRRFDYEAVGLCFSSSLYFSNFQGPRTEAQARGLCHLKRRETTKTVQTSYTS